MTYNYCYEFNGVIWCKRILTPEGVFIYERNSGLCLFTPELKSRDESKRARDSKARGRGDDPDNSYSRFIIKSS